MGVIGCVDFVWEIYTFDNSYYAACKDNYWDDLDFKCVRLIGVVVVETFLSLGLHRFGLKLVIFII